MAVYQLKISQKIPTTVEEIWAFISSPYNLKKITPNYIGFQMLDDNLAQKMYPGMMIRYKVSPILNIKMTWVTEITQVKELDYFVDEQRVGPYKIWHHEHFIKPIQGGVQMDDCITYQLPMGILGNIAHGLFVKKQLNGIFVYRKQAIIKLFGEI